MARDNRIDDLPDDFFDTYPGLTKEQRAEMKRKFRARQLDSPSQVD